MRVIVAGVPGAGKTSIMSEVSKKTHHTIVNYGTVMLELAREEGVVEHRDDIRRLPIEKQRELQRKAAERIGAMDNIIVDTHLTIKTASGYFPGLPVWVLEAIKVEMEKAKQSESKKCFQDYFTTLKFIKINMESLTLIQKVRQYVTKLKKLPPGRQVYHVFFESQIKPAFIGSRILLKCSGRLLGILMSMRAL